MRYTRRGKQIYRKCNCKVNRNTGKNQGLGQNSMNSTNFINSMNFYSGIVANRYTARAPKRKGIDHAANTGGMMPAYPIEREKVKPSQ